MNKAIYAALLCVFLVPSLQAQITKFKQGDVELSASVGVLPTFIADNSKVIVPPLGFTASYRITQNFSLGAYAAYSSSESDQIVLPDGSANRWRNDFILVGLKSAVHANPIENWDIYGGFLLGYNIPNPQREEIIPVDQEKSNEPSPFEPTSEKNFTFGGFIGAGYYFQNNVGVFGEIGYGISLANVGIKIKI